MRIRSIILLSLLSVQPLKAQLLTPESLTFPNVPVSTSADQQTECVIAVNPVDSLNLVAAFIDLSTGSIALHFSIDGGVQWSAGVYTGATGLTIPHADPWLAFDATGVAYCSALGNGDVILEKSTDKGQTWSQDVGWMNDGSVAPDEPILATDLNAESPFKNSRYVAAVDAGGVLPKGIVLQYQRADSDAHSSAIRVGQQQLVQIPHMAIGPTGTIYLSYIGISNIGTLSGGFYFNKSRDGGQTFDSDKLIQSTSYTDSVNGFPKQGFPSASRIGPTPRIAIDTSTGPRRGWLYVCYAVPSRSGFPPALNIFLQRSTDDGATWSSRVRVNTDPLSSTNDHFTPSMAVNPDGTIAVAYYDRRDDANNLLVNLYVATSTDGGVTFTDRRVSTQSTDPLLAYSRNPLSIADYIGIAVSRSTVYPIWTDGRKNTGDLDISSAQVPLGSTGAVRESPLHEQSLVRYAEGAIHISGTSGEYGVLIVRDVLGREALRLFDGIMTASSASFPLERRLMAPGVYFAEFRGGGTSTVVRFVYGR